MKIHLFLWFTSSFALQPQPFIRNIDKPPCILCKHYLPDTNDSFDASSAKCKMFGGKDTHTGTVLYEYAVSARRDEIRCSVEGKYFEGERHLYLKQAEHTVRRAGPLVGLSLFSVFVYLFFTE